MAVSSLAGVNRCWIQSQGLFGISVDDALRVGRRKRGVGIEQLLRIARKRRLQPEYEANTKLKQVALCGVAKLDPSAKPS